MLQPLVPSLFTPGQCSTFINSYGGGDGPAGAVAIGLEN